MRRVLFVLAAAAAGCTLASSATAAPPTRVFVPASDFTISGACVFDVQAHTLQDNEYATVFSDGSVLITGTLNVQLTNLSDPSKSIDLNISGPTRLTFGSDGSVTATLRGPQGIIFVPGQRGPGTPGALLFTTGLAVISTAPDGTQTFTQTGGTSTDLCAVLSDP